ncbi:hypothetical protein QE385_004005 [Sphingomonas sp. SORGH_AS 950]|uniref:muramidase n=1 Tax=Sphingomonas sp. SORGH_AS_0950 TaxID=3041792 RepID=UPI00277E341C|nr:muramidase [Sphingomonas sp. SORGH_AS_0950]MDQ1159608.1 hypothetical protein [Sphingomonas sp. SORGH_AS_0950]
MLEDAKGAAQDLLSRGADHGAGPLDIEGRDFTRYPVTPASLFDAGAAAHTGDSRLGRPLIDRATVSNVARLVRGAFGGRVTDTIRPMNAAYGARYSWHKYGQAIDFVPAGGVNAIDHAQIRALMGQNGVRLIELLGPGDPGHSDHWHIAFARADQVIDRVSPIEGPEDWFVNVAGADAQAVPKEADRRAAPASALAVAAEPPPQWDIFATAE